MLEAIAIFLTLLTVICGIVTYISAHNNPLNIPDISKGGSIATVILLISAIVTGLWPSSSMYRDCGDLTETALDHRKDLLAYELVSTGGAVDELRQEPRDEILSFFRDNESCFEIPRELAVYRVAFTDELEEADRQRAIDVLGRNGEHLRRFALVVHPDYSVDQNWRSILSIYIDQWAVLPRSMAAPTLNSRNREIPRSEEENGRPLRPDFPDLPEDIENYYRAATDEFRLELETEWAETDPGWTLWTTERTRRTDELRAEIEPVLEWVDDGFILITVRTQPMVESTASDNCEPENLSRETTRTINRQNSIFTEAELASGLAIETEGSWTASDVEGLVDGSWPGRCLHDGSRTEVTCSNDQTCRDQFESGTTQCELRTLDTLLYVAEIQPEQQLGRNTDGEISLQDYPQVRDAILNELVANRILDEYEGVLAPAQAVQYAQTAISTEMACFTIAQTAREACNYDDENCDRLLEASGMSEDTMDEQISTCREERTLCYLADAASEYPTDVSYVHVLEDGTEEEISLTVDSQDEASELCTRAAETCDDGAVVACSAAVNSCSAASVLETLDETRDRCRDRALSEVEQQCFEDQTATYEEPSEDDEDADEED